MGSKNSKNTKNQSAQSLGIPAEHFETNNESHKYRKWLIIMTVIISLIIVCMICWKMCKPRYTINLELDRMGIPGNIQEFAFLPEITL